jgi:deazaflavin-dependent oxidoreductase (nitroreductase family)
MQRMSFGQRFGALTVAGFALAFTRTPWLIRFLNPAMTRRLRTPRDPGPNALLTVRGRRSGLPRSAPVAFLDLGDRAILQAASAEVGWVRNLRASREAVITHRGESEGFEASELSPEAAGQVIHDLLAPFPRSRLIRSVVGPHRPPVAVLHYFRVRVDDALADYIASARRQPVFELHPGRRTPRAQPTRSAVDRK